MPENSPGTDPSISSTPAESASSDLQTIDYKSVHRPYELAAGNFVIASLCGVAFAAFAVPFLSLGIGFPAAMVVGSLTSVWIAVLAAAVTYTLLTIAIFRSAWRMRFEVRRSERPRKPDAFFHLAFRLSAGTICATIVLCVVLFLISH